MKRCIESEKEYCFVSLVLRLQRRLHPAIALAWAIFLAKISCFFSHKTCNSYVLHVTIFCEKLKWDIFFQTPPIRTIIPRSPVGRGGGVATPRQPGRGQEGPQEAGRRGVCVRGVCACIDLHRSVCGPPSLQLLLSPDSPSHRVYRERPCVCEG